MVFGFRINLNLDVEDATARIKTNAVGIG